ncbi:MAG TPA: hypothetical protein VGK09_09585 [Rhodocyclaceae bacterium]|jgi:hypothetical protein
MGSLSNESFDEFLDSLKLAGIEITNEKELRERLAEVQHWRYAFRTLAANGRLIGIRFQEAGKGSNEAQIRSTLNQFHFPQGTDDILTASIKAE